MLQCFLNGVLLTVFVGTSIHYLWDNMESDILPPRHSVWNCYKKIQVTDSSKPNPMHFNIQIQHLFCIVEKIEKNKKKQNFWHCLWRTKLKFKRIIQEFSHWWESVKTIEINEDKKNPFSHSLKELTTTEEGHFGTSPKIRWIHPNTVV